MNTEHMLQYALVGPQHLFVPHTEKLSDAEVRRRAGNVSNQATVQRWYRCPACQVSTLSRGKLRANTSCPAVRAALETQGD